ncbi:hypothetical protein HMPREF0080_01524 [Anaeroglobus geminatus F0357]|uniref:Uncharacterized protein n=1 Tax=Anaeroglobus geminatus F0357 TaxID=861450 RepID=G9YIN1_9FIRM|nr:hypothetical protein HMPREF0080_01524 [Anaeroglobus geminatus F0357]
MIIENRQYDLLRSLTDGFLYVTFKHVLQVPFPIADKKERLST